MTTQVEQNKSIVRRFYEAFSANDEDAMRAVLVPDLVAYTHGSPDAQDREQMLQGIRMWSAAFETYFEVEEQIAEGDSVATRVIMRVTHNRGDFRGHSPTGKQVVVDAITIEHIRDGKIARRRVGSDFYGMMLELGLMPEPQSGD